MKRKLLISSVLLTLIIMVSAIFVINKNSTDKLVLEKKEEIKEISEFNGLSLMYETGPGTGKYSESKSSTWPEEGYIFNENLSACENGSKLSWNEELGAVNLKTGISDKCYVYFDAYIIPVINSVSTSNITTDSITLTVNATDGNNPITTYYYSSNNGSNYVESTNNTYTFNNLEMGTEYNFSVYVKDSLGYESEPYTLSEATDDTILLAEYVISQYTGTDGENGLYFHDADLENGAGDNSYRYAGANPNNYVCFGSDASTCPDDNLYRIIGVFGNQVKLIMADYPTSNQSGTGGAYSGSGSSSIYNTYKGNRSTLYGYNWNPSGANVWSSSTLTTINLNSTFFNSISSLWKDKIVDATWYVNGYNSQYATPATWQAAESTGTTWTGKIGLMYVSDYGFAASPSAWMGYVCDYGSSTVRDNNWMYLGVQEWTISRDFRYSDYTNVAYCVDDDGGVTYYGVKSNFAVRPVFYLNSSTEYSSGSGTESDPIRIVV